MASTLFKERVYSSYFSNVIILTASVKEVLVQTATSGNPEKKPTWIGEYRVFVTNIFSHPEALLVY